MKMFLLNDNPSPDSSGILLWRRSPQKDLADSRFPAPEKIDNWLLYNLMLF
jgi:hypothetical protein